MSEVGPNSRFIAIDGGGTRCRLALGHPGTLGHPGKSEVVEVGAANVTSDFDAAIAEIKSGLAVLAAKVGIPLDKLTTKPAYVGLAGMTSAGLAARVSNALPLRHARVGDDRHPALRGALGTSDGAVAHFGTGSFFAFQAEGQVRLVGGWGARLADEGSAFWVGRLALTATLEAVDGLIDRSALTERVLTHFGAPGSIVEFASRAEPTEFGAFAPWVTAAANRGDLTGLRIMKAGAEHISRVVERLGWRPGMALCLTGGLGPAYRDHLSAPLAAGLVAPKSAPLDGALDLAREFALEVAA